MGQDRVKSLALLAIEIDISSKPDLEAPACIRPVYRSRQKNLNLINK